MNDNNDNFIKYYKIITNYDHISVNYNRQIIDDDNVDDDGIDDGKCNQDINK